MLLAGCSSTPSYPPTAAATAQRQPPATPAFQGADLLKSDTDAVAEIHLRESLASVKLLVEKLYKRNPREYRKGGHASTDAAMERLFDPRAGFRFRELNDARGTDAILLALKPEYPGDRVFAYGAGLGGMILMAYNDRTDVYLLDTLDAQKLYNAARNVEIAAWKLASARDAKGQPLLLSNEIAGDVQNLSFEREIGKLVAYQDVMAVVTAQRTNRAVRRVIQGIATAVFLPI